MPCFRTCSTCMSRSQAPLCHCTQRLIANQPEGTFGPPRYCLGGDRPSQPPRLPLSPTRIHGSGLEPQYIQGGISTLAPPRLAPQLPSLPPILHDLYQNSTSGCSKGPRGLSVLSQLPSIFTRTSISPDRPHKGKGLEVGALHAQGMTLEERDDRRLQVPQRIDGVGRHAAVGTL